MATTDDGVTTPDVDGEPVGVEGFAADGSSVATVPVHISYGIIERFSEGLYSSPNKTFEELVTNSYDAGAERVWVYLPTDFEAPEAALIVIDDTARAWIWRASETSGASASR